MLPKILVGRQMPHLIHQKVEITRVVGTPKSPEKVTARAVTLPHMDAQTLWKKAVGGIGWMALSNVLLAVLQVAQMLVMAATLGAGALGEATLALVFLSLSAIVTDAGLTAAVVHFRDLTDRQFSALVGAQLVASVVSAVFLCVFSGFFADWLQSPALPRLLGWGILGLLLLPFGSLFNATLLQQLRFDAVANIESQAQIAGTLTAIVWAIRQPDAMAMVAGWVVRNGYVAMASLFLARHYRRFSLRFSVGDIAPMLRFGRFDAGSQLINQASVGVDKLLLGYFSGPDFVGAYALAWNVMSLPLGRITPVVTRVAFPVLSRLQAQPDAMMQGYRQLVFWLTAIQWPIFVGLWWVSSDFVRVFFGEKWLPAVPILQVLCWVGTVRSIGVGGGMLLTAMGETRVLFRWNLFWTVALTAVLLPFAAHGGTSLAWGQLAATLTAGLGWHVVLSRFGGVAYGPLLRRLSLPAAATAVMLASLWLTSWLDGVTLLAGFLAKIAAGGLTYAATFWVLFTAQRSQKRQNL